ncbi:hypothetical protein [Caldivirga maquilingensis]|nr:hypothetical protein [Caldivirga maquilingensis]
MVNRLHGSHGIRITIAVVIITIAVTAGYWFYQGVFKDSTENSYLTSK